MLLLNNNAARPYIVAMKQHLIISAFALLLTASTASASCLVEFKAKRDNPTEYRHDIMEVPDQHCTAPAAKRYVRMQLAARGWTLLAIVKKAS